MESSREVPVTSSPKMSSHVCTPPSVSSNQIGWSPPQDPPPRAFHQEHPSQKQQMHSTTNSRNSLKADATQIKEIAGDGEKTYIHQIAASTASWLVCSVRCSPCARF
ncbi:hypothetical protein DPEC_G00016390 [Dallia pectoralis]|uniref:Uncharacterized protein n=1 Tax=Dallia pectoralis TaxID=75939 RepID=A0ACC2HN07_DALPE|nr:hypothetical protein DPEC_G00016390 [Dallia pectoralis]